MALILVKYGLDNSAEKIKIENSDKNDCIVLIQNGIYWNFSEKLNYIDCKTYVIKEDFLARGYDYKNCKYKLIDYAELVDIIEKEEKFIG